METSKFEKFYPVWDFTYFSFINNDDESEDEKKNITNWYKHPKLIKCFTNQFGSLDFHSKDKEKINRELEKLEEIERGLNDWVMDLFKSSSVAGSKIPLEVDNSAGAICVAHIVCIWNVDVIAYLKMYMKHIRQV